MSANRNAHICSAQAMYRNVYDNTICNSQKLKAKKRPSALKLDTSIVVCSYNGTRINEFPLPVSDTDGSHKLNAE